MPEITQRPIFAERRPSIPYHAIGGRIARQNPTIGQGCPCCGAAMGGTKPYVDLNSHTLIRGNKTVALNPTEARLCDILLRRAPGVVTHDTLIMNGWGAHEPEDAANSLKTHMCYLRRKAALLGIGIVTVYTVGYRMEFDR